LIFALTSMRYVTQLSPIALFLGVMQHFELIRVWHLLMISALTGLLVSFEQPVRQSILHHLVPREDLPNAVPLYQMVFNGSMLFGPSIMRGMLTDVGTRLRPGAVTHSRTVRVTGDGEGIIAAPLEAVAKAHPAMSLGSYPFFGPEGYGSNLVLRGRDLDELAATVAELIAALKAIGIANVVEVAG